MKIAVPFENGEVFQHFGQTREFKVFDSETKESMVVGSGEYSHGGLATLLQEIGVSALICGGIGDGARRMLNGNGIKVYSGNKGNVDEIAEAFMSNKLDENNVSTCHHDHECHCH